MSSLTLDTNAFLRFLLDDIPEQADQVSKLLARAKKEELEIIVPQIVIFEVAFALDKFYKLSKEEVVDKLRTIITAPYLKIQDINIFQEAVILFKDTPLDFVDSFLQCFAQSKSSTLFTFDKKLQNLIK